jgi:hypothetical protein
MRIDSRQPQTGFTATNNSNIPVRKGKKSCGDVSANSKSLPNPPKVSLKLSPNVPGSSAADGPSGLNPDSALELSRSLKGSILADPKVAVFAQANIHPQRAMELLDETNS